MHGILISVLEDAIRDGYPILIIAEYIKQEALATLVANKLRGSLKIAALRAPGFETVIRDELGLTLDIAGSEVLGMAAKVALTKDSTTIVGDDSTQEAISKRIVQIKNLIEEAEQDYGMEKLNERITKLSGGVIVIQDEKEKLAKSETFAIRISNIANMVLFIAKFYASISSGSLAIVASTLDSLLDLLSGFIPWFTAFSMSTPNPYQYPIGKKRMQPLYTMERGVVHVCHVGGVVHCLEGWQHHEVGAIDVDRIDVVWQAALWQD